MALSSSDVMQIHRAVMATSTPDAAIAVAATEAAQIVCRELGDTDPKCVKAQQIIAKYLATPAVKKFNLSGLEPSIQAAYAKALADFPNVPQDSPDQLVEIDDVMVQAYALAMDRLRAMAATFEIEASDAAIADNLARWNFSAGTIGKDTSGILIPDPPTGGGFIPREFYNAWYSEMESRKIPVNSHVALVIAGNSFRPVQDAWFGSFDQVSAMEAARILSEAAVNRAEAIIEEIPMGVAKTGPPVKKSGWGIGVAIAAAAAVGVVLLGGKKKPKA